MNDPLAYLTSRQLRPLPRRSLDAHKTSAGSVLVLGGSWGMAGAAFLAAAAALRAGAGYVRIACPESIYCVLAALVPSAVFVPLACSRDHLVRPDEAPRVIEAAGLSDVAIIGPGYGQSAPAAELFSRILPEMTIPMVLDGSALGLLAAMPGLAKFVPAGSVITPHPGEAAALLGMSSAQVQAGRMAAVRRLAAVSEAAAVLKGRRTLVCDGVRLYENTSGNAGMAKAGSGDVLSGITAAFLAQAREEPCRERAFDAASLAVYLHGKAGDAAARGAGRGLMAEDIIEHLPPVVAAFERGRFETGA